MPNTDQSTNAARHNPPETACPPGFNQPDTLDWSSLFAQVKNQLILIPSPPPRAGRFFPLGKMTALTTASRNRRVASRVQG